MDALLQNALYGCLFLKIKSHNSVEVFHYDCNYGSISLCCLRFYFCHVYEIIYSDRNRRLYRGGRKQTASAVHGNNSVSKMVGSRNHDLLPVVPPMPSPLPPPNQYHPVKSIKFNISCFFF